VRIAVKRQARQMAGLASTYPFCSVASRSRAFGIRDKRCREREQTDCEHDERAVQ